MIGKTNEYVLMHEAETQLWWYRYLHSLATDAIAHQFRQQKNIAILDAGCGTGGLLLHLQKNGYHQLMAIDADQHAIQFAQQRTGIGIQQGKIQDTGKLFPPNTFDVICCMDVFTYMQSDAELIDTLQQFRNCLKPGGFLITNNNAFRAFKGTHDFAVGIGKRFVKKDWEAYAIATNLHITHSRYWNFLLSPIVFGIRKWKLLVHHSGIVNKENISSDIDIPSPGVNQYCLKMLQWEEQHIKHPWWGTSLFTLLQKPEDARTNV